MQSESLQKSKFRKLVKDQWPELVVFRIEDVRSSGTPDWVGTYNYRSVWLEFKYANPKFETRGIQKHQMLRLSYTGYAFFVIFREEKSGAKSIYTVLPEHIDDPWQEQYKLCEGFDYRQLLLWLREQHA